jgi:ABC-type multidrug transport system fused ATPase/permease subunit
MMDLIRIIPRISAALACFHRVQTYLLSKSREDYRVPLNMSVTGEMTKASENYERSGDIELRDLAGHSVTATEAPLLVISEASFGWADTIRPVLQDISISIGQSQTTFIIGNVGCGKSTLMRAMLGEIQPLSGRVYSGLGKVAYVGQDPWIQNLTIRENILGVSNHDHEWYATVIQACGLEQDIHELLYGDATKAGSSGVSLSGGQKQRLALARAVYSRAEVVFLDDVFSGQDARTESHIYQSLFGERGLFQAMGTTVVCITGTGKQVAHRTSGIDGCTNTSSVHGLVHADRIIALGEDGRVLHQGSFDQLKSDTDYLHGLQLKKRPCGNAGDQAAPSTKDTSIGLPRAPDNDAAPSSMVVGELATYAYYFGSIPGWYTFLFVSAMVVCACSNKMTELLLSFWTAHAEADSDTNGFYLGLYAMLSGLALLAVTAGSYFYLIILVPLTSEVLHARLLRTVVSAPLSFFSKTDIGVTTNRFSQDMSIIDVELPFTLVDLVINLSVLVVGAVLMCVFSGFFAAVVPPVIFFCWRESSVPLYRHHFA